MAERIPSGGTSLEPTFFGVVLGTMDALVLFEATLRGTLSHIARRPHDRERTQIIKSGNVFIYEEHSSGIKRWTDGVPWSPSRILGNFLLYRELNKGFAPGEKKRANKKNKDSGVSKPTTQPRSASMSLASASRAPGSSMGGSSDAMNDHPDRHLIGSLVDSYEFKTGGLMKKTISIQYNGVTHHLVSYYNVDDVKQNKLQTPFQDPRLKHIFPRPELISSSNFRAPVDDREWVAEPQAMAIPYGYYGPLPTGPMTHGVPDMGHGVAIRSMSVPNLNIPGQNHWTTGPPTQSPTHAYPPGSMPPPAVPFPGAHNFQYNHNMNNENRVVSMQAQSPTHMGMMDRRHSSMNLFGAAQGDMSRSSSMHFSDHGVPIHTPRSSIPASPLNGSFHAPSSQPEDTSNSASFRSDLSDQHALSYTTHSSGDSQPNFGNFSFSSSGHVPQDFSSSMPRGEHQSYETAGHDSDPSEGLIGMATSIPTTHGMEDTIPPEWAPQTTDYMPDNTHLQDSRWELKHES